MPILCKLKQNTKNRTCVETKDPKEVSEECEYNIDKKKCLTRKKTNPKKSTQKTKKKPKSPKSVPKNETKKDTVKKPIEDSGEMFCKLKQNKKTMTCEKTTNPKENSEQCLFNPEKNKCYKSKLTLKKSKAKKVLKSKIKQVVNDDSQETNGKKLTNINSDFMTKIKDSVIRQYRSKQLTEKNKEHTKDIKLLHKELESNKNNTHKLGHFWLESEIKNKF
jgi:hypothetical protein